MNNGMTVNIIKNISQQYNNPADKRAFEKAIAALEYCKNQGLTYYVDGKYFGKREEEE